VVAQSEATRVRDVRLWNAYSHVNDAIAAGQAGGPPIPVQLPAVVWHVYNPSRRSRKLFDENFGVAKYRHAADRQPGVDKERMRVEDHEHNKRNRSYRRHVRNKYYRDLRQEGRLNESLLGPSGKEIYSPNEAIGVTADGQAVVVKRLGPPPKQGKFKVVFRWVRWCRRRRAG